MQIQNILKILERIKRVQGDLKEEYIPDHKLDLFSSFIKREDNEFKFLTSTIDIEKAIFEKYKLEKNDLENINKIINDEISIATAILEYLKKNNYRLGINKKRIMDINAQLDTYKHVDSDILLSLLYEENLDNKLYFYDFVYPHNISINKDFIEIISDGFGYTSNYEKIYDLTNEYLKITFPVKTFIAFLSFNPMLKTTDEYAVFIDEGFGEDTNKNIYKQEQISMRSMIPINGPCYSITIKGTNIQNILDFDIMVGSKGKLNSNKKGYVVLNAKLDRPNGKFKIVSADDKRAEIFVVDKGYIPDPEKTYDEIYTENATKNQLSFNKEYDDSLVDNNLIVFYNSNEAYYKALKLIKL